MKFPKFEFEPMSKKDLDAIHNGVMWVALFFCLFAFLMVSFLITTEVARIVRGHGAIQQSPTRYLRVGEKIILEGGITGVVSGIRGSASVETNMP
jgi:hypothetical protein